MRAKRTRIPRWELSFICADGTVHKHIAGGPSIIHAPGLPPQIVPGLIKDVRINLSRPKEQP